MSIKRGDIWLANLDPTIGSEINKTRPVLIVSNNTNNEFNKVITILPITSNTQNIFVFKYIYQKVKRTCLKILKQKQIK